MRKKINLRIMVTILLSLVDDGLILVIVLLILPRVGIAVPMWAIGLLAVFFLANILVGYYALRKNPQLGFENMIGKTGLAVEPVGRRGSVRINGQLWFAMTTNKDKIEVGTKITVIDQSGLKLIVIRSEK